KTETISIAAMTIMSRSSRGLPEPRAGRWACRANEAFIQNLRGARLNRVYKGETDRDYIDGSWRVRNSMKALRTRLGMLPAECQLTLGSVTPGITSRRAIPCVPTRTASGRVRECLPFRCGPPRSFLGDDDAPAMGGYLGR